MYYIRTHIFLASRKLIDSLGSIISINRDLAERLFIENYDSSVPLFREDAPLSKEIRNFIFFHMTSMWYRKMPYTAENFYSLRGKAISILNSLLLSMRVKQQGYPLIAYEKVKFVSSNRVSKENLDRIWIDGTKNTQGISSRGSSDFWVNEVPFYNYLPEKKLSFSWQAILMLLSSKEGYRKEHL